MNNYSKKSCEIELKNKYGDGLVEAPYEFKQNEESFEKLYNVDDQITLGEALFEITKRFIPSSLALVIEYCILVINLTFISVSSDTVTTSGCGLGNATINILVFSVGSGFCGGIDTLVSQAFGRKDYYLCGVYLNTSRIVTILLNMVQLILLLNSESLFLLLGQNEETAFIASQYMVWILPGLFLNMQFECLRRFLLVQGIYRPIMFILSITFVIHIIGLYLFLIQLDLKLYGVAISSTITYTLNFLLLTLYVHYKKDLIPSESWHLFNKSCLTKIPNYLEFALPACLLNMVEWWAFELMVIFCGMISQTSLVTLSIILTINTMIFMFTQGISYTCTSLVGNNLGANHPNKAKVYSRAALYFGWIFIGCAIILIMSTFEQIVNFYTSDQEVQNLMYSTRIIWMVGFIADMTQGVCSGIIRAMGYQSFAMKTGVIFFWLIMIPVSYTVGVIMELNTKGVYLGVPIGAGLQASTYIYILFTAPWKEIAEKASAIDRISDKLELEENHSIST